MMSVRVKADSNPVYSQQCTQPQSESVPTSPEDVGSSSPGLTTATANSKECCPTATALQISQSELYIVFFPRADIIRVMKPAVSVIVKRLQHVAGSNSVATQN